jgi:uncharacterized membrane protein
MPFVDEVVPGRRSRIESVDLLRGMIMIVMALDHTRDFLGNGNLDPTNLPDTTTALFLTRWVTHFCAPVFFLLTGTGAFLSLRSKSKPELSRFLFTRGLWLIFLELTVVRCLGWQFNFDYHLTLLGVLWALGWSMIVLSALVYLPTWAVTAFGLVLIATHNLFDAVPWQNTLWKLLHRPSFFELGPNHAVFDAYVLIPWIGVTAAGYGLGQIYRWPGERRKRFLLSLGVGVIAGFILLRWTNLYGNPFPWTIQPTRIFTMLSFVNTAKYPPSLLYLMMTLGPAMIFLWAIDAGSPRFLRPALTIGKVPLFYYVLHIPLIHLIAVAVCFARYHAIYWMFESTDFSQFPTAKPPGWGLSLPLIYLAWAIVVITLYPLCRWYSGVKQRSKNVWLGYL